MRGRVSKVGDADGAAADLVFISRADATAGGADLCAGGGFFARGVDILVPRESEA